MARSEDTKAPEATVAYAHNLFELQEREGGKKGFGCSLLFKKGTDISGLQNLALDAAVAEWGDKAVQWIKDEVIKNPFLDGDGKQAVSKKTGERHPGFAGHTFIRCVSGVDYKPKVFDKKRNPVMDKAECPSGSKVFAVVNAFTWENKENGKGISFGISLVQVIKKAVGDEILGGAGGPDPDKFLEKIDDEGDAPETTKGGAGAAGLFG
jgi:hypothetical protein